MVVGVDAEELTANGDSATELDGSNATEKKGNNNGLHVGRAERTECKRVSPTERKWQAQDSVGVENFFFYRGIFLGGKKMGDPHRALNRLSRRQRSTIENIAIALHTAHSPHFYSITYFYRLPSI